MSVHLYDRALLDKLRNWTKDTDIHIYGPDDTKTLFETIADATDDKPIQLPIICLRRNGGYEILNPNMKPMTYDGMTLYATQPRSIQLNAIPISLQYQIDIYTKFITDADEYTRNIVFNIVNYPKIALTIPYNDSTIIHESSLRVASTVEDNSAIPERLIRGQFSRFTLNLTIDDAYLWDVRQRNNKFIDQDSIVLESNGWRFDTAGQYRIILQRPRTQDEMSEKHTDDWIYHTLYRNVYSREHLRQLMNQLLAVDYPEYSVYSCIRISDIDDEKTK